MIHFIVSTFVTHYFEMQFRLRFPKLPIICFKIYRTRIKSTNFKPSTDQINEEEISQAFLFYMCKVIKVKLDHMSPYLKKRSKSQE